MSAGPFFRHCLPLGRLPPSVLGAALSLSLAEQVRAIPGVDSGTNTPTRIPATSLLCPPPEVSLVKIMTSDWWPPLTCRGHARPP